MLLIRIENTLHYSNFSSAQNIFLNEIAVVDK